MKHWKDYPLQFTKRLSAPKFGPQFGTPIINWHPSERKDHPFRCTWCRNACNVAYLPYGWPYGRLLCSKCMSQYRKIEKAQENA